MLQQCRCPAEELFAGHVSLSTVFKPEPGGLGAFSDSSDGVGETVVTSCGGQQIRNAAVTNWMLCKLCREMFVTSEPLAPGLNSPQTTSHLNLAFSHRPWTQAPEWERLLCGQAEPTGPLRVRHTLVACAHHAGFAWDEECAEGRCEGLSSRPFLPFFPYPSLLQGPF